MLQSRRQALWVALGNCFPLRWLLNGSVKKAFVAGIGKIRSLLGNDAKTRRGPRCNSSDSDCMDDSSWTIIWTAFCPTVRLPLVFGNLNLNWKACLLLLTPLFYRTIQAVLQRIKKWPWGMESQEPEDETKEKTPKEQLKPSPTAQGSTEEEA